MGQCQACRREAPTKYVEFYQNIGMLVMRQMRSIKGNLCKSCARKHFKQLTGLTLVTGWWGMISMIINPCIIIHNVVRYCGCMRLAEGPGANFPVTTTATPGTLAQPSATFAPSVPLTQPLPLTQSSAAPAPVVRKPAAAAANAPHPLDSYRNDILIRLRGGQSAASIAQFLAPRTGVSPSSVQQYIESIQPRK